MAIWNNSPNGKYNFEILLVRIKHEKCGFLNTDKSTVAFYFSYVSVTFDIYSYQILFWSLRRMLFLCLAWHMSHTLLIDIYEFLC